jgi:hypothetical protein
MDIKEDYTLEDILIKEEKDFKIFIQKKSEINEEGNSKEPDVFSGIS